MGHAMRAMVPTGVNTGGGQWLGRLRRSCCVSHTHGLRDERRISAEARAVDIIWVISFRIWFTNYLFQPATQFELQYEAYVSVERYKRDWLLQNLLPSLQWCAEGEIPGTAGSDLWFLQFHCQTKGKIGIIPLPLIKFYFFLGSSK